MATPANAGVNPLSSSAYKANTGRIMNKPSIRSENTLASQSAARRSSVVIPSCTNLAAFILLQVSVRL